jgi:hypothetical protein
MTGGATVFVRSVGQAITHALLDRSTLTIFGVTGVGDPAAANTGSL